MDYSEYTIEQLIGRLEELEILNQQLLREKEQETGLDFAWTGNLGHWYWNVKTNTVNFNPLKITTLGYTREEIPAKVNYQFFTDLLHPDDLDRTMKSMRDHLHGTSHVYECEYRIRCKDGCYKWYYDRGRITQFDEAGKPLLVAGIVFDISAHKEAESNLVQMNCVLSEQARTDGMTKIPNYRSLIEDLKTEISQASQTCQPLSLAMFDIDFFKKVNDTKGHPTGDKVLVDTARIMKAHIRESDIVGRYGGEEFLLILRNTPERVARTICERIRQSIEDYHFPDDVRITISGGLAEYHGESVAEFIQTADQNLYQAKKSGRNRII